MTRNSLVLRLAAAFALTTFALVGLGSAYLYSSLNRILMREGEDDLGRATEAIIRQLEDPGGAALNPAGAFKVRVLAPSGRVVLETPGMPGQVPGRGRAGAIVVEQGGSRYLLLDSAYAAGRVQVARELGPEERRLGRFRKVLWATLGLTSLVAAVVGLGIARRGLRPLRLLADQAREIHPESLATRLHLETTPAELGPLVEALNRSLSRLETAFARLTALNADMAHELRTPVHALKVETERLLARKGLPLEVEDGLSGMMETLDHLGTMLGQMLFLARIEDPAAVLTRTSLSAAALLRSAMEPFELLAEEAGVLLSLEAPPDLVIQGDGTLLRRALHNLLDNAIRHSPAGATVALQAWETPEAAVFCVSDQGPGIPEAQRQNVGQRFLRSDPSRSRGTGGTGLGLAIVQSILHLHGGVLDLQGRPGGGTRAHLILPT